MDRPLDHPENKYINTQVMKKTERFQNIKLDIQTEDFDPTNDILSAIRVELKKLMRIYGSILGANVYLSEARTSSKNTKMARMKVGAPGRSYTAEAYSDNWSQALSEASGQLRNQLLDRNRLSAASAA